MAFAGEAVRYFTFDTLSRMGVKHAVFTRKGGVSPSPWAELNLGGSVGDEVDRVKENKKRAFQAVGLPTESIYDVWQVHSSTVVCTETPRSLDQPPLKADALLTDSPEATLFMRFADCVPIFLYDPEKKVVGLTHAGWLGTVNKIVAESVRRMVNQYGCNPRNILACIGPSIGPDHYQVREDVLSRVRQNFGKEAEQLLRVRDGATFLDLWRANQIVLEAEGVKHVEIANLCTACHLDDWYSHRAENGKTGRFGALISLKNGS